MVAFLQTLGTTGFSRVQASAPAQIYALHNEVPQRKTKEETMEETVPINAIERLAWAVLSRPINGRSEVIKVTNYEEADQAVQEHPDLFYKSGPFVLT